MDLAPGPRHFEPLADHMGPAYLRYSFTKGTLTRWTIHEPFTKFVVFNDGTPAVES